jgi:hypothetical protein
VTCVTVDAYVVDRNVPVVLVNRGGGGAVVNTGCVASVFVSLPGNSGASGVGCGFSVPRGRVLGGLVPMMPLEARVVHVAMLEPWNWERMARFP